MAMDLEGVGYVEISTAAMVPPWQAMGQSCHGHGFGGGRICRDHHSGHGSTMATVEIFLYIPPPPNPWPWRLWPMACHGMAMVTLEIEICILKVRLGFTEISTAAMVPPWQDLEGVGYVEISTVAMALPWKAIG